MFSGDFLGQVIEIIVYHIICYFLEPGQIFEGRPEHLEIIQNLLRFFNICYI